MMKVRQLANRSLQLRKIQLAAKDVEQVQALILQAPGGADAIIGKLAVFVCGVPALKNLVEFVRQVAGAVELWAASPTRSDMIFGKDRRSMKNPYLILAFASLCWSGNHIVGRAIAGHFPPLTISTIRWFIPAIILWIAWRTRIEQDWLLIRRYWVVMLWLGATGGILFSALQYVGLQYTSAVNVSILNSLVPVLIIAASALIFRDRILPIQLW